MAKTLNIETVSPALKHRDEGVADPKVQTHENAIINSD